MDEPFRGARRHDAAGALRRDPAHHPVDRTTVVFVTLTLKKQSILAIVWSRSIPIRPHRTGVQVDLPKPRNQLTTRESPAFLRLRRALFDFIREGEA